MDEVVVSTTHVYETLTVDESVIVIEQQGEIEVIEPFSVMEVVEVGQVVQQARISADALNRLTRGSDDGLYVSDDLAPDPLAYYILAKS